MQHVSLHPYDTQTQSQPSLQPTTVYDPTTMSRSEPARSPHNMYSQSGSDSTARPSAPPQLQPKVQASPPKLPNLDYLSFGNEPEPTTTETNSKAAPPIKTEPGPTDWEKLLGSLDNGETNIYDACYGGPAVDALLDVPAIGMHNNHSTPAVGGTPLAWTSDLWALCPTDTNTSSSSGLSPNNGHAASLLSFSTDEGVSSSEDFSTDWNSASSSQSQPESFRGIVMPSDDFSYANNNWESALNI